MFAVFMAAGHQCKVDIRTSDGAATVVENELQSCLVVGCCAFHTEQVVLFTLLARRSAK
jgi:hypothetical protein